MTFRLPKVYPITDRVLSGLAHTEQVRKLIVGGATVIQLREKQGQPRQFYADAAQALQLARRQGVRLLINDRVDIALALGADGVHLGQSDMPVAAARQLLGHDAIIGFSTHNAEQAELATEMEADYIAFGPVYSTSTKQDHEPVAGLAELARCRQIIGDRPLVAIGGIDLTNVQSVLGAGADAAAIIGAIVANPERISENFRKMLLRANS